MAHVVNPGRSAPARTGATVPKRAKWVACALLWSSNAHAWILPEHAQITADATQRLEASQRAVLQALWNDARRGSESELCPWLERAPAAANGAVACLGFAELPAVAGDHSCTPEELFDEVSKEDWLRDVIQVGNQTERRIREARSFSARVNAWSHSNLLLERADDFYATRATSNSGHFVPTASPGESLDLYLAQSVHADEPLNATGLYVVFHLSALRFAAAHAAEAAVPGAASEDTAARRAHWARRALLAEAFALHFLEDSFAAGHTVGTWGGPAMMKGTHDQYSIDGVPSRSWSGEAYSPHGDAFMTPEDLQRSSRAVATSLADLTNVVTDQNRRALLMASWGTENAEYMWEFNTCTASDLGFTVPSPTALRFARPVWEQTVMPMPGEEHSHMPRFRAEIGPFFAFGTGVDGSATWGGYFTDHPGTARGSASVLVFAGLGIGLEGAIGISSDGLIELGFGRNYVSEQYEPGCEDCGVDGGGTPARVPTRSGMLLHYRAPYWLVPGDLLVAAPFLLAADFNLYKSMAVMSANGGLLGLQRVVLTPIGTFQFVLGRELNVMLFNEGDQVLSFNGGDPDEAVNYSLFEVNSVKFDAPVFVYQPFRAFSNNLTSAIGLQLGGAIDFPSATNLRTGESGSPGTAYSVYLRLILASRWYLGSAAP
jgi:hypothetical protein